MDGINCVLGPINGKCCYESALGRVTSRFRMFRHAVVVWYYQYKPNASDPHDVPKTNLVDLIWTAMLLVHSVSYDPLREDLDDFKYQDSK